ncbi:synaptonemal complex protein 2-like isoform X2 [Alligator sinensis]|uniref:Synaptonemal complex protein 2-like isoform X2 n=1 Tax=Alligator sinensis TaxID=38654 RepID=A0A1U7RLD6_ALLSI|nr:synaptonemal complex protein 2-like isoform X2 [Alligator sinensis]
MEAEKESPEGSSDLNGNMAARTEYYLESLITDVFKGKGFQKISELFQEKEICPPQKFSKQLFNQLDKVLKKELDKNEFQNVSVLLKCIQLYFKSDPQEGASLLIQQGLIPKMVTWFERTREFLMLIEPAQNNSLMKLVEDFFDSALVICKCDNEGKKQLLESFLPDLGQLVTEGNISCAVRQEALRTFNSLLDSVPREERKKIPLSEEMCALTKDLAKTILEVGDYDLQVALSEALCRLMTKKWRDDLVHHWFEDNYLAEAFKEIKDREFETDCRKFLNQLNDRLGDKRRVYSVPCVFAVADMDEVKKPSDEKLEEFWIDFNLGSQSLTFYIDSPEGALWESVRLSKEAVSSYSVKEVDGQKEMKILMKHPATVHGREVTKIKLVFTTQFDILSVLKKILGEDKMMIIMGQEDPVSEEAQTRQNGTLTTCESTYLQQTKDTSSTEKTDSLSDILASQYSDQSGTPLTRITSSSVSTSTASQPTEMGVTNHVQAPETEAVVSLIPSAKFKTPSPRMSDKPSELPVAEDPDIQVVRELSPKDDALEKKKQRTSLVKQMIELKEDSYKFETSSDPGSHVEVTEAKQKILGQRVYENGSAKRESGKVGRRLSDYRKHLFSESNHETTSNSQSEKSWILDSQKKPLLKAQDYTRRRPRLRMLPLSSASSGSDYQTKKVGVSRPRVHQDILRKETKSSTATLDLSAVRSPGDLETEDLTLPFNESVRGHSDTGEGMSQKFENMSSKLAPDYKKYRNKRKVSDLSPGDVLRKPKLMKWETNLSSPRVPSESRNLFVTVEKKKEPQTGQKTDDLDDVFYSKILDEDVSDTGVIAAFESFTNQLKKTFWSKYKRMEILAQNALKTSEKTVSALLNQIHQCRLNKLENFHKIVVQELATLEDDAQTLSGLEKATVDFWNKQSIKLSSFCDHQKKRIQAMDSVLEETTKSFKDTVQNTKYENLVEKVEESSKVVIVPSD